MASTGRTLLQIVNAAQSELGLPQSSTVIGNSDVTTSQMLGLAQLEIEELRQKHDWTILQNEYNLIVTPPILTTGDFTVNSAVVTNIPSTSGMAAFNWAVQGPGVPVAARILSVDSPTQITMTMEATGDAIGGVLQVAQDTYPEPSDFDYFLNRTWYDRTNRWQLLGPDSPQQDQFVRSGIVALGPRRHFRQLGSHTNNYRIWPAPYELVDPIQLVFEYNSLNTIMTPSGTPVVYTATQYWTTDSDLALLDNRALIMGLKWRFWAQKGMNSAVLRSDYDDYIERLKARDGGAPTLSLVPASTPFLVSSNNVQDGNYPGPNGNSV